MSIRLALATTVVGLALVACGPASLNHSPDDGQIIFGTDLDNTGQSVKDKYTSVQASTEGTVSMVASFSKNITGPMAVSVSRDGGTPRPAGEVDCTSDPCGWLSSTYNLADMPPGHYVFTITAGSEAVATGELDITP